MIQLVRLHIEEFRGIRDLDLDLAGESLVVYGPNGSGKSGVVDAIEFVLTGSVGRLSGVGTGSLSVLRHGPHVHKRDDAAAARVSAELLNLNSGEVVRVTRSVKAASEVQVTPDTDEARDLVGRVSQHPELVLSRREVIKFIVAEPGKRSQEVQALLRLDRLTDARKALKSAQGKTSSSEKHARADVAAAENAFLRHVDLPTLASMQILQKINGVRSVLALELLQQFDEATDPSAGIDKTTPFSDLSVASVLRDLRALRGELQRAQQRADVLSFLVAAIDQANADSSSVELMRKDGFLLRGMELVTDNECPFCGLEWETADALRLHVSELVRRVGEAKAAQAELRQAIDQSLAELRKVRGLIKASQAGAIRAGLSDLADACEEWTSMLTQSEFVVGSVDAVLNNRDSVSAGLFDPPGRIGTLLTDAIDNLEARPDEKASQEALAYLTIAKERWSRVVQSRRSHGKAVAIANAAQLTYRSYCEAMDAALKRLYESVEQRFEKFYRRINSDDEGGFTAALEPSSGKLELSVDFYGTGKHPPAAYHSEGHQDGMGVCLYLALVHQLLGDDFRFTVLDDVVMSVDSNHRRQFCELLMEEFPRVQFVITTHDEVWANQMESTGLVSRRNKKRFHGWTVDGGPIVDPDYEVWERIERDLKADDVPSAAHKLRRSMEASMQDLAESLKASVPFKSAGRYDLGELLSGVKGAYNGALKKARNAANSWSDAEALALADARKANFSAVMLAQQDENWAINALVHHNNWATMTAADFRPVVSACSDFLSQFRCGNDKCSSWIYLNGSRGNEEELRCRCGSFLLNLRAR